MSPRRVLEPLPLYYHPIASSIYYCIGSIFAYRGRMDLAAVLGNVWAFEYPEAGVPLQDFAFSGDEPDLTASLAAYHGVEARWGEAADPAEAWGEARDAIDRGNPLLIGVDNYYLHFRPAYRDVHANHLVLLHGYDDEAGAAYVLDATPPRFKGPIPLDELARARAAGSEKDGALDLFFAGTPLRNRWLELRFPPEPRAFGAAEVTRVLRDNVARMSGPGRRDGVFHGAEGIALFADHVDGWSGAGDGAELRRRIESATAYIFGTIIGERSYHADFLRFAARTLAEPRLEGFASRYERLAHSWSALRIILGKSSRAVDPGSILRRATARLRRIAAVEAGLLEELSGLVGRQPVGGKSLRGGAPE